MTRFCLSELSAPAGLDVEPGLPLRWRTRADDSQGLAQPHCGRYPRREVVDRAYLLSFSRDRLCTLLRAQTMLVSLETAGSRGCTSGEVFYGTSRLPTSLGSGSKVCGPALEPVSQAKVPTGPACSFTPTSWGGVTMRHEDSGRYGRALQCSEALQSSMSGEDDRSTVVLWARETPKPTAIRASITGAAHDLGGLGRMLPHREGDTRGVSKFASCFPGVTYL